MLMPIISLVRAGLKTGAVRQGVSQPLMIMIPSKLVPSGSHGVAVGLRISLNRLMQTVLPPIMGGVVGMVGLEKASMWSAASCSRSAAACGLCFAPRRGPRRRRARMRRPKCHAQTHALRVCATFP